MNLLFLLDTPSVRDYRIYRGVREARPSWEIQVLVRYPQVTTLSEIGTAYEAVGSVYDSVPGRFNRLLNNLGGGLLFGRRLFPLLKGVDWVYTHNFELLAKAVLKARKGRCLPRLVHDVSDFYAVFPAQEGLRDSPLRAWVRRRWEREVFLSADLLSFNSTEMLSYAKERFELAGQGVVVSNGYPESMKPERQAPKLSQKDGRTHLVYVGHLNEEKLGPLRAFSRSGYHVHVYTYTEEVLSRRTDIESATLSLYQPVASERLAEELSAFDYGLVTWSSCDNAPFYDLSLPGKLFDYLAAGLPVVVSPCEALKHFVRCWNCGVVVDIQAGIPTLPNASSFSIDPRCWQLKDSITPLLTALERDVPK